MTTKTRGLKRELSLFQATMYGVGIILGAGIYVLLGAGAGAAGNAVWAAFLLGAVIAGLTGLSYAELASRFPRDAAEYVYTEKAFGRPALSFLVEWLMLFTILISAATVARGFAGYLFELFSVPQLAGAVGILIALSVLNYAGMKESARFAIIATFIEMSGLLIVAVVGAAHLGAVNYLYSPHGFAGVISAAGIVFFAYIGFEQLANFSEETKNAAQVLPRALIFSLIISTALYILVSIAAVGVIGWQALAQSSAPLADVVMHAHPLLGVLMSFIALFATANTVLALLITGSRLLYGLSANRRLPAVFAQLSSRATPGIAVGTVLLLSAGSLALGGLKDTAVLTDIGVFIVYVFVNLALIAVRMREKAPPRGVFRVPLNAGRLPLLALAGAAVSALMLFSFELHLLLAMAGIVGIGAMMYLLFNRQK